ncbi:MAG: 1,5-anhydro-D-fructose reductase [Bacteroidetes bacterium ADurb.Bin037]|nr:MAG: 1,5-anhydro-D-fructose reductase [Bacteroidetes bacterium ADurb.Bin037]HPW77809.1 Gfo/Idh/MocA family oxidoreductase [Bacteroidales bacterium]HQB55636.1 Gfo/Idh/MocA family oxidoreductase [Bacteroidales bacterium]
MIRFATIGSNVIVDSFLRGAAHDPRFQLQAVYSRTQERATEFAAKHGAKQTFTSLEALAACPQVDAVYIASPNIFHAPQAILMMEHGKHVLCEKPLAPSFLEGKAMIVAARRYGVVLMEAMKTTLLPNFFRVKETLPCIGTVRRVFVQFCQYSSRYDNFKKGVVSNVFQSGMGGGALRDLGVYGLALVVHLFGMPRQLQTSKMLLSTGVDGQGSVLMGYPEMEAVVVFSKISDSFLPSEIQGENGRILIGKLSTMEDPVLVMRDGTATELSVPTIADEMYYQVKEFIDVIESGAKESAVNTHQRSLDVLELVDRAS